MNVFPCDFVDTYVDLSMVGNRPQKGVGFLVGCVFEKDIVNPGRTLVSFGHPDLMLIFSLDFYIETLNQ